MALNQTDVKPIINQDDWLLKPTKSGDKITGYILSAWYVEKSDAQYRVWALVNKPWL